MMTPHDSAPPDSTEPFERGCLGGVAAGDRAMFEALYRRTHPRLARFLHRFTRRPELIDEVINETMWVVWRQAGTFRGESRVSTWITGIAYRCMLKALRGGAPVDEVSEAQMDPQELAAALAVAVSDDHELRDWVASGLRSLPDDQRVALELAYFGGHSCEEIAAIMGCAVGTVKARLFHARVRLRSVLPVLGGRQAPKQG